MKSQYMSYIRCVFFSVVLILLGNIATLGTCGDTVQPYDLMLVRSFVNPLSVTQVGFSKNGLLLACNVEYLNGTEFGDASLTDAGIHLWKINTGEELCRSNMGNQPMFRLATKPFTRIYAWTASGLEVQDDLATSNKVLLQLQSLQAGIDTDGRYLFPIDDDGSAEMGRVFFSGNDEYIAALRSDKSVHVWSLQSGKHVGRFALPDNFINDSSPVRSLAFDPTNRYLAAGVDCPQDIHRHPISNGMVIVWNLKTGKRMLTAKEEYRVFQVTFSPDGNLLCGEASGGPHGMDESGIIAVRKAGELDDANENARIIHTPCGIMCIAVIPRVGIVTGDWHGQVLLWDIESGKLLAVAKKNGRAVFSLAVGQNGMLVASGDLDGVARLWRITKVNGNIIECRRADNSE
jgi:WD40 repeat protein